jgi:CDP-diacylglycerol--serine O-phosphatidyltransferase
MSGNGDQGPEELPKVYLLPNLMTAGNLFCGFMAVLQIIEGTLRQSTGHEEWVQRYTASLSFILGAFIFDLLDGRLARLGGRESPFGREFDSLADVVSFGIAPALLVYKIVLAEFPIRLGWLIAFFYLLCGVLRLARFNVVAARETGGAKGEFVGFPIPAAAGVIASITLLLLHFHDSERELGAWKYSLPALMVFLSCMMFSKVRYPSFKAIDWGTRRSLPRFIATFLLIVLIFIYWRWMLAIVFIGYLLYGFLRPRLSIRLRREIEDEVEEDEAPDPRESAGGGPKA